MLFADANCAAGGSDLSFYIESSRSVNFTGLRSWFNDETTSFMIVCC